MSEAMNSGTKRAIKGLGEMYEERKATAERLKEINDMIAGYEETIAAALDPGLHKVGEWVCKIEKLISNGRKSTSWKEVADSMVGGISTFAEKVLAKYPDAEAPIRLYSTKMHKHYDAALASNTKEPQQSTKISISDERQS